MSEEVLSQNQVENLLRAMEAGNANEAAAPLEPVDGSASSAAAAGGASGPRARTSVYDFKRPERVGKEQMRAMQSLHEGLARGLGAGVSTMLRTMVEVKLMSVDQLTYSEFIYSLDNPTCFNLIRPEPLDGSWVLDIAPPLAYSMIDRMLGGDPQPGETIKRALTVIETRLIGRVTRMFLDHLTAAWENVLELKLDVERVESNPQIVQIVPPNEVVILVGLEVTLGRIRGMMNLCIPYNTIERFSSRLTSDNWVGYAASRATDQTRRQIADRVDRAAIEVVVTLARSRIRTGELLELAVGDLITTEQDTSDPLEIAVQSVPKFRGRVGTFKGKKAVRIDGIIEDPKRTPPQQAPPAETPHPTPAEGTPP